MAHRHQNKKARCKRISLFGSQGYTLVEIALVMTIIAVLSAIAFPSFLRWLPGYRLDKAAREVHLSLMMAKSQALKANSEIVFVITQQALPCTTPGGGSYLAFVDDGGSLGSGAVRGNRVLENTAPEDERVIISTINMPKDVCLTADTGLIGFNPRGFPIAGGGSITLSNINQTPRVINISVSGRVNIQ